MEPVHPIVERIVACVSGGSIPTAALAEWKLKLAAQRSDRTLFRHLVGMWARLDERGFPVVAAQMLMLARIGLEPAALIHSLQRLDSMRIAKATLPPLVSALRPPRRHP